MFSVDPLITTFVCYITVIALIGLIAYFVTRNVSDYVLGGRRLSAPLTALGSGASDMSGWLMLGLPGAVYVNGLNQVWMLVGLIVGAYCNWRLIARRLRVYTERVGDAQTIPAYFHHRFADNSKLLGRVSAAVILVFFTVYAASGFVACAMLFKLLFGISYHQGLLIGWLVIVLYSTIGGFLAVSWIDFLQGSLMFVALLVVPAYTAHHLGSWVDVYHIVQQHSVTLTQFTYDIHSLSLLSLLAWGLGYFGQPHILVRFMAIRDPDELSSARWICMSWMSLALLGAVLTGFSAIAFFTQTPLAKPESAFLELAKALFNPWITGVLLAAVLSAIMSTIAAQLLAAGSAAAVDYYAWIRTRASGKEMMVVARVSVLIISGIAAYLSLNPETTILNLVAYAWSGIGAAFGPLILISLYWPRMTRLSALVGMLVGAIAVIIWSKLAFLGGIFELYSLLPGFILSSIAIIITSLVSKPPYPATIQAFQDAVSR